MVIQASPSVYVETDHLGSNNGIIVGDEGGLVLVDAPHKPTDARKWATRVAEFGRVDYLIHTDHHPDHTIGNAWMGGTVVAHDGTRRRLQQEPLERDYLVNLYTVIDPPALDDDKAFAPRLPQITFDERMTLHLGRLTVELHHVPGHTANTIAVLIPEEGVIFTGDNVCPVGLPSFQDSTIAGWFDALDTIERFDFEILIGGHGDVVGREIIDQYRDEGRTVIREVADGINQGRSREDLVAHIRFPDRIHLSTDAYVGYPADLVDFFQRSSIGRIFDDLTKDGTLASR